MFATCVILVISCNGVQGQKKTAITQQANSSGAVGDVRYSILDEMAFRQANNDTDKTKPHWVLMDGRIIAECTLNELLGQPSYQLPDARGVFIRGMNLGRPDGRGDTGGNRNVGVFQGDTIQEHTHTFVTNLYSPVDFSQGNGHPPLVPNYSPPGYTHQNVNHPTDAGHPVGDNSKRLGAETRPRNITLYTYIKIN